MRSLKVLALSTAIFIGLNFPSYAEDMTSVIAKVMPGTVEVFAHIKKPYPKGPTPFALMIDKFLQDHHKPPLPEHLFDATAVGSGVIVDMTGVIVTNAHVADSGVSYDIIMDDGTKEKATLVGIDKVIDIAVLQIHSKNPLTALKFGDSDRVQVGNPVFAVGNPLGQERTVTSGIISNTHREQNGYDALIQTDASINHGNSGGGLFNKDGEVIGLNEEIISPNHGEGSVGLGFAIPSNVVVSEIQKLLKDHHVPHGLLGIEISDVDDFNKGIFNLPNNDGAFVSGFPDDSSAKDIFQVGDVIISFDNHKTLNSKDLLTLVHNSDINKNYQISFIRNGKVEIRSVKLKDSD